MSDQRGNGLACIMGPAEWSEYKIRTTQAIEKVEEVHADMTSLVKNAEHLARLPAVETLLADIKDGLIGPATSKRQVDTETFQLILKIFGAVIIGLVLVIVFLLTGHFGLGGLQH